MAMGRRMTASLRIQRREVGSNSAVVGRPFGTALPLPPCPLRVSHPLEQDPQPHASSGEVGMVLEDRTKVLVGSREVVLFPSGTTEGHDLPNRRWLGGGSGARYRALIFDLRLSLWKLTYQQPSPSPPSAGPMKRRLSYRHWARSTRGLVPVWSTRRTWR